MNELSTLADVRVAITEDEIEGVPESYLFLFCGAPVSKRQECRRRAVDCFPFLTLLPESSRIQPTTGVLSSDEALTGHSVHTGLRSATMVDGEVGDEAPDENRLDLDILRDELPIVSGGARLELQITDGPLEGTTVTVGEEGARIGRHASNTLVIPEAGISRYHCEICWSDDEFCVRDLGSTTGTFFYLKPHGHFHMFVGLMVKLGETEFQVLSQALSEDEHYEQVVLFYEGPLAGHKVHVPEAGITIGRRHDNNVVLVQDGTVSAHHAVIFCEDRAFFITDLGSCNGTCVRLSAERSDSDWHPIMEGDVLGAGCTKIRCRLHQ